MGDHTLTSNQQDQCNRGYLQTPVDINGPDGTDRQQQPPDDIKTQEKMTDMRGVERDDSQQQRREPGKQRMPPLAAGQPGPRRPQAWTRQAQRYRRA